jgi:hypothetical protein
MWRSICDFPDENRPPICGKLQRMLCYNAMGFTFKNQVERPSKLLNKKHSALNKNIGLDWRMLVNGTLGIRL